MNEEECNNTNENFIKLLYDKYNKSHADTKAGQSFPQWLTEEQISWVLAALMENENKVKGSTSFYTEGFDKLLLEVDEIIYLKKGDLFKVLEGNIYELVWKLFSPKEKIMIYHGKPYTKLNGKT